MPDDFPSRLTALADMSELQFSKMVDELKNSPATCERLTELLHEDNPIYDQRGTAATTRMRGWVLLALGQQRLSERALLFVFEELDNGRDAYLVTASRRPVLAKWCVSRAFHRSIPHTRTCQYPVRR